MPAQNKGPFAYLLGSNLTEFLLRPIAGMACFITFWCHEIYTGIKTDHATIERHETRISILEDRGKRTEKVTSYLVPLGMLPEDLKIKTEN